MHLIKQTVGKIFPSCQDLIHFLKCAFIQSESIHEMKAGCIRGTYQKHQNHSDT